MLLQKTSVLSQQLQQQNSEIEFFIFSDSEFEIFSGGELH